MAEVVLPAAPAHAGPVAGLRRSPLVLPGVLLVGFAAAVALRCAVGGAEAARSRPAGLVFALALAGLAAAGRARPGRSAARRIGVTLLAGVLGALVLCLPALLSTLLSASAGGRFAGGPRPGFVGWAVVVTVVATAEEAFLRGTLVRLLARYGAAVAIGIPALAFAALHVPLYGWGAAPLDLAVGVWLGALRLAAGSWAAPAVAHVLADWAAWALT